MASTYDLPPDLAVERERIGRRQALYDAMLQQGLQPIRQQVAGGRVLRISPFEGLAKLAQSAFGAYGQKQGDEAYSALANKYQTGLADAVSRYNKLRTGTPGTPEIEARDDAPEPSMPATPGTPGDPRAAVVSAITSPYAPVRKLGEMDFQHQNRQEDIKAQRDLMFKQKEFELEAQARRESANIAQAAAERRISKEEADNRHAALMRELAEGKRQLALTLKSMAGALRNPPAPTVTTVVDPSDPTKLLQVDARIYKGGGMGSPGVIGAAGKESPQQKRDNERTFQMEGIGGDLQAAEDLLLGVKRTSTGEAVAGDKPTGSGIGKAFDTVAGVFGATPKGAAEAGELKVVAARLVGRVPRFEGPQSDKDTKLYKEAAGEAGDEGKPREIRLAAIRRMRELYSGYESGTRGRLGGGKPAAAPKPGGPPPGAVTRIE